MPHVPNLKTEIFDGLAADRRLRKLGLDARILRAVVERGEAARAQQTANDPVGAGALDAYRYRVRALRDLTGPQGWTLDREGNLERTISPDRKVAIITRAGDEGVGLRGSHPQPKRPAGNGTREMVGGAFLDPDWMNVVPITRHDESGVETWMLLVYRGGDTVRYELSRPTGIAVDGEVLGWYERILLPEIDYSAPERLKDSPGGGSGFVIDVPVFRK